MIGCEVSVERGSINTNRFFVGNSSGVGIYRDCRAPAAGNSEVIAAALSRLANTLRQCQRATGRGGGTSGNRDRVSSSSGCHRSADITKIGAGRPYRHSLALTSDPKKDPRQSSEKNDSAPGLS